MTIRWLQYFSGTRFLEILFRVLFALGMLAFLGAIWLYIKPLVLR